MLTIIVFLEINGVKVFCTDEELFELGLRLANVTISDKVLLDWIIVHT